MSLKIMFRNFPVKLELQITLGAGILEFHNLDRVLVRVERLGEPPVEHEVEEESSVRQEVRNIRDETEE